MNIEQNNISRKDNLESVLKSVDKTEATKNGIDSLNQSVTSSNPILKNIDTLKSNNSFNKVQLKKGEVLFSEGQVNNNLYFILEGNISIEKYTTKDKTNLKQLAVLGKGDFLGEGSLKGSSPKEVNVVSLDDSELLLIDGKLGMADFIKENLSIGLDLLVHIIDITNKRLLEANSLVTSSYEMSTSVGNIKQFDNKNLFALINKFQKIIGADYIVYLETNNIMPNYINIKYDTRNPDKMLDHIIDKEEEKIDTKSLKERGIELSRYNHVETLKSGSKVIGYLILGKDLKNFNSSEQKIITTVSISIAGVIEQKRIFEEEVNKEYMKLDE